MARTSLYEGELPRIPKNKINAMALEKDPTAVTSTSYTVVAADRYIMVDDDTAGSTVTITLPLIANSLGRVINIKKLGSTASVIIDGNGAETIDGDTNVTITVQYVNIVLYGGSSEWHIL